MATALIPAPLKGPEVRKTTLGATLRRLRIRVYDPAQVRTFKSEYRRKVIRNHFWVMGFKAVGYIIMGTAILAALLFGSYLVKNSIGSAVIFFAGVGVCVKCLINAREISDLAASNARTTG